MLLSQGLPENVKNIQEYLSKNYADLLHSSGVLSEQIDEKLQEWQQQSHSQLLRQFPFELYENQLSEQQNHFQNKEIVFNEKHISEYKNFCQFANVPFDGDFWHKQLNLKKQKGRENPKKLAWQLMLNQWQKQLDQAKAEWYLQKISELRQQRLRTLGELMSLNQMLPENVKNIQEYLSKNYADLLHSSGVLSEQIDEKLQEWQQQSHSQLLRQFPFELYENQLSEQQNHFQNKEIVFNEKHISEYKNFCQFANVPFDGDFWHKQLNLKKQKGRENPKKLAWQLMLNQWQKQLDQAKAEWYLHKISELRQQFLKELEKWLDIIRQLSNQLDELGLDTGLFLDNSMGSLTPQDIEQFKRWFEYLKNNENAKKIAELLGKMRQIEQSEKIEQIQKTISVSVPNIDVNSREEIIGLRLGRELEYVLPSELALMADEDTSILFDLKYMENKLMRFELQGIQFKDEEQKITIEQEISEDEKLGPMILCVDTSSSMSGLPENIAKAMALYLANKAKSEKRDCFIINFSTQIETFEINQNTGIKDLIQFLKMSFHGGTDVAPALRYALNLMQTKNYQKSDVLLISDFVMSSLADDVLQSITIQRENANKFNSLVIGDEFMNNRLKTHFDNEWIYNPHSKNIQELVQFQREITSKNGIEN